MFIGDMFNEDSWNAGDNAWSSEHDQWAKESVGEGHEDSLNIGDEVLVDGPNQFQGKRGWITGFGRNKAFVIVEIDGKEYSMHSSDVVSLGNDEDEDEDLNEYKGAHDKVTFEIDSEKAYNHVMDKYGHVIDWNGDYMTAPARYWPAIQELAFAAGGDVQEIELSEGAGFGAYYYEQLAQKVFDERPNFSTSGRADELVDYAYRFAVQDLGKNRARYEFNYDEDFLSDFVSAYGELQRRQQGVAEDLGTMAGAAALGGAAAYGIGQLAGKMINKFDKKYDGADRTTARKHKDSCACEKCRGSSDTRLKEGASVQEVFNAITYRIERQMPELFTDYGVEVVASVIKDVAEFYEGAEEIGSSDVGAMVRQVVRQLKQQELRKALDEVKKMSTQQKFEKHLAKHGYDVNAKQKYWDQKIKDIDAQIAAWDAEMAARKQNKGVAEDAHQQAADEIFNNLFHGGINAVDEKNFIRSVLKTHGLTPADAPQVIDLVRKLGYAGDKFKQQGVAEAKGLNKRVRVVKTGETGTIRQIKHGAFKGAPKSYFVDLDDGGQADNLPASALRLIKDQGVAEGEYDDPRWEPGEPDMSRKVDWDIEAERNKPEEQEAAKTVTITDYDGKVVLTFPSTGGFYGDKKYAASKGFDTDSGDYRMSWKRVAESGQGDDSTSPVGGNVHEGYWAQLQQERYLKEHKKAFSMLDELNEVFKDK